MTIDWGLYLIIAFSVVQAIVAVAVLLFDAGVITPPAPRPRYEQQQQQYGQYGGPGQYYGQPHGPARRTRQDQQQQQRPGYPSQYGGGYPGGPSTRRIPGRPAGLAPDAAHRFPHLRPAAVEQRSDDTGAGTAVVFLAVRPAAVVIWAARASTSRA